MGVAVGGGCLPDVLVDGGVWRHRNSGDWMVGTTGGVSERNPKSLTSSTQFRRVGPGMRSTEGKTNSIGMIHSPIQMMIC